MSSLDELNISKKIGEFGINLAQQINFNLIISAERSTQCKPNTCYPLIKLSIFKKTEEGKFKKLEHETKIKKLDPRTPLPIKELIMDAIANNKIQKEDKAVFLQDASLNDAYKSLLCLIDINHFFSRKEEIHSLLEPIIDLAMAMVKEGREGKKVGTTFVITNEDISKHTRQLILNPFQHFHDEKNNIQNQELIESIKEFSQLDGAFIINQKGKILSAGTYLDIQDSTIYLPAGLGARHSSAAAITNNTDSIAVVISESGQKIRVFKKGKIILEI